MALDLDSRLDDVTEIRANYRGLVFIHSFRNMTMEEWKEYNSRLGSMKAKRGHVVADEKSLTAVSWLLDKVRLKVEAEDVEGSGDERVVRRVPLTAQQVAKLQPNHHERVLQSYLSQTEVEEADFEKNSEGSSDDS